jgi:hypothetical protein
MDFEQISNNSEGFPKYSNEFQKDSNDRGKFQLEKSQYEICNFQDEYFIWHVFRPTQRFSIYLKDYTNHLENNNKEYYTEI